MAALAAPAPAAALVPTRAEVWDWLADVPDPEIPVVSVIDLGIVRDVAIDGDTVVVTVTPTYSGCPATSVIALDIEAALAARGVGKVRLERRLSPPWSSDFIGPEAQAKLKAYGIAPPQGGTAATLASARAARLSGAPGLTVECPRCGSAQTERISQFGSTPCKASWRCRDCREPFDYFKCI